MSNAAAAANIVSLDEYRRARGGTSAHRSMPQTSTHRQTVPYNPMAAATWVYWVPVWVW